MTTRHLLIVPLIILSSCAPKRSEFLLDTGATKPDALLRAVEVREARISSLTGRGILTFDSPEMSGSASFESNMKKPDSLLVTLEGPFGIDVGTFFLSRDKYVMYNSFENSVSTGNPHGASIRSVIPFDLTTEQILDAFAGVFAISQQAGDLQSYTIEDGMFLLSYRCGANLCKYWIDPAYLLVARYQMSGPDSTIIVEAKASAFTQQDDVTAARRVSFRFPAQDRQLSVAYNSLKLNVTDTDFHFTIPSNARQITR